MTPCQFAAGAADPLGRPPPRPEEAATAVVVKFFFDEAGSNGGRPRRRRRAAGVAALEGEGLFFLIRIRLDRRGSGVVGVRDMVIGRLTVSSGLSVCVCVCVCVENDKKSGGGGEDKERGDRSIDRDLTG